ncbi:hypothetical protein D3C75_1027930 [compost metagenome]
MHIHCPALGMPQNMSAYQLHQLHRIMGIFLVGAFGRYLEGAGVLLRPQLLHQLKRLAADVVQLETYFMGRTVRRQSENLVQYFCRRLIRRILQVNMNPAEFQGDHNPRVLLLQRLQLLQHSFFETVPVAALQGKFSQSDNDCVGVHRLFPPKGY